MKRSPAHTKRSPPKHKNLMSSAFAFTKSSDESLSNEAFAGLFIVCMVINAYMRTSSVEACATPSMEEEIQEVSHTPAPPAPAPPAPAPPAPAPPAQPVPAPAPASVPIHEGLTDSVLAVLSKSPQTAREICSKLSEAYPILTKSEVNSCLYSLSAKKQAKQVYSPKGSPRWTII